MDVIRKGNVKVIAPPTPGEFEPIAFPVRVFPNIPKESAMLAPVGDQMLVPIFPPIKMGATLLLYAIASM
jgi:hypothetical protein